MNRRHLLLLTGALALAAGGVLAVSVLADTPNRPNRDGPAARMAQDLYERALRSVGDACTLDNDCPSPLRCRADACAEPLAMVGGPADDTPMVLFYGSSGEALYYLEIADDPQERSRGLMHRPSMLDEWGMLFVYPSERPLSFWMQNTYISLDMVFIAHDGRVVGVVENAEPLTTTSRAVPGESQFVVELNAGQAAQVGIEAGIRSEFLNLPPEVVSTAVGE